MNERANKLARPLKRMFNGENESNNMSEWGVHLSCPVCLSPNVHFEKPGYQETDNGDAWAGRGRALRIPMWCESGHHWGLRLGFHKGDTYLELEGRLQTP